MKGKMMKKILALVLVMAVSVMAVTFTGTDNGDGTVTVSFDAPVVGMALNVDSTSVSVTDVTLPVFFDVFMDYASVTSPYAYKSGHPIADKNAAGVATLPSMAFCISAGGLEDGEPGEELTDVPAAGEIVLAVTGTGDVVISANTLRGGVVDYNGAMTTNLPITINVADDTPTVCLGDADGDGWISPDDLGSIVVYINNYAADGFWVEVSAGYEAYDYDQDGWVSPDDLGAIVVYINNYAADGFWVECAN